MIELPVLVPWWAAVLMLALGVIAGVAIAGLASREAYENGRIDGIKEAVDDLMDMTARSRS